MAGYLRSDALTVESGVRLPAPVALMVETKSALDGDLAGGDILCGAFLEAEEPVSVAEDALDAVMREIDMLEAKGANRRRAVRVAARHLDEMSGFPEPLMSASLAALERKKWRFAGVGIRALEVCEEDGVRAEILRIEPGFGVPQHAHKGQEFTLVLCGAFEDGIGRYQRGEISSCGPNDVHRPVAAPGEVCYVLTLQDTVPAFTGFFGAIQKFARA